MPGSALDPNLDLYHPDRTPEFGDPSSSSGTPAPPQYPRLARTAAPATPTPHPNTGIIQTPTVTQIPPRPTRPVPVPAEWELDPGTPTFPRITHPAIARDLNTNSLGYHATYRYIIEHEVFLAPPIERPQEYRLTPYGTDQERQGTDAEWYRLRSIVINYMEAYKHHYFCRERYRRKACGIDPDNATWTLHEQATSDTIKAASRSHSNLARNERENLIVITGNMACIMQELKFWESRMNIKVGQTIKDRHIFILDELYTWLEYHIHKCEFGTSRNFTHGQLASTTKQFEHWHRLLMQLRNAGAPVYPLDLKQHPNYQEYMICTRVSAQDATFKVIFDEAIVPIVQQIERYTQSCKDAYNSLIGDRQGTRIRNQTPAPNSRQVPSASVRSRSRNVRPPAPPAPRPAQSTLPTFHTVPPPGTGPAPAGTGAAFLRPPQALTPNPTIVPPPQSYVSAAQNPT
ncbi:MAG TPA: hypothetical protein VGB67_07205, partial [Fibrella sp.]